MSYKKWTCKLIVALLCCVAAPVWAAQAPITLEAHYLQYNDETGEVSASGDVKLNQEATWIYTQQLTGNVQTGDMLANGQVTWTEEQNTLTGEELIYNYKTKEGRMGTSRGNMDGQLITAESTVLHPQSAENYNVTVTKCPAKVPDYKMTAEKVVIYPGEKLIAYNVGFWLKNTKIYSMGKYVKRLDEKERESALPKIGYRSDDGFFIIQHLAYPMNDKLTAVADVGYYTKQNIKGQLGLVQQNKHATLSVMSGSTQNSDGDWYRREPEIAFTRNSMPIGATKLKYGYQLQASRVAEDARPTMWQEKATLWVYHDPIKLAEKTTLSLGTSYQRNWYGKEDPRDVLGFSTFINHQLSNRISLGAGYNYTHENQKSPFTYDDVDVNRELVTQFGWQVDRLWHIGVRTSYDLDQSSFYDVDYTIKRNLHCFETEITYREKRDEWKFRLSTVKW